MGTEERMDRGVADLHMHTTASDGTIGIDRRVKIARKRGLETIAITDHDVIPEKLTEPVERWEDIEVVTGVEVRAGLFDTKVEILGYFIDPTEDLQTMLQRTRDFRRQRNADLVSNLAEVTDLNLSYEELSSSVEGNLGRPHLANVLVERGVVDSVGEAFSEFLAEEGEAFVPMERLPVDEVVDTIHEAGGIASLAHPGRIRAGTDTVERMLEELSEIGLDGLEVRYPYRSEKSDEYAEIDVATAATLADRFNFIPTGGSDCHGPDSGKFRLGEVRIEAETLGRLRMAASGR